MNRTFGWIFFLVLVAAAPSDTFGGCDSGSCGSKQKSCCQACGCDCCPCDIKQHTVMVPMCITETRMKVKIVREMQERKKTYTVFKRVPEKRTYSKECCYLETEVVSKEITKEKCRRVKNDLILEDTIRTPVIELHSGVRRREACTACGKSCIEEPCACKVVRAEERPRVRYCKRQDVVFEKCKETIDYCVKTPKSEKIECGVETIYKLVPVEKTCMVQVCVPKAVQVPVDIKVQRMVAKQIYCCDKCWCNRQQQNRQKMKRAEHREKIKTCANPAAGCEKLGDLCGKMTKGPKKVAASLCNHIKKVCKK